MASSDIEVDLDEVQEAAKRVAQYINRTPVMTSSTLDSMAGRSLHFKCELFQKTGSFKVSSWLYGRLSDGMFHFFFPKPPPPPPPPHPMDEQISTTSRLWTNFSQPPHFFSVPFKTDLVSYCLIEKKLLHKFLCSHWSHASPAQYVAAADSIKFKSTFLNSAVNFSQWPLGIALARLENRWMDNMATKIVLLTWILLHVWIDCSSPHIIIHIQTWIWNLQVLMRTSLFNLVKVLLVLTSSFTLWW